MRSISRKPGRKFLADHTSNIDNSKLEQLHHRMRSCTRCIDNGHEVIPQAIFSGGSSARIMIIGQAPGITEVEAGRPFNAGSGSRLFRWLSDAGIEEDSFRAQQYMTSVTKCFPGKAPSGSGDRVPSRAEQKLCRPFLDAEIELVNPSMIIPVGRLAINLFFPARLPLAKIIGQKMEFDTGVIIPLPHPSGASRWHQNAENRERIKQAVDLITEVLGTL